MRSTHWFWFTSIYFNHSLMETFLDIKVTLWLLAFDSSGLNRCEWQMLKPAPPTVNDIIYIANMFILKLHCWYRLTVRMVIKMTVSDNDIFSNYLVVMYSKSAGNSTVCDSWVLEVKVPLTFFIGKIIFNDNMWRQLYWKLWGC